MSFYLIFFLNVICRMNDDLRWRLEMNFFHDGEMKYAVLRMDQHRQGEARQGK